MLPYFKCEFVCTLTHKAKEKEFRSFVEEAQRLFASTRSDVDISLISIKTINNISVIDLTHVSFLHSML